MLVRAMAEGVTSSTSVEWVQGLGTLAIAPVSSEQPAGENVRYEPVFESLSIEIGKLQSIESEPVDWKHVVDLAATILKEHCKDFLVAAYFAAGKLELDGLRGMAEGLWVIDGMIDRYWETAYPPLKRLRARAAAIQWLAEVAGEKLETLVEGESRIDDVSLKGVAALLHSLLERLDEKLQKDAPSLTELLIPLRKLQERQAAVCREEEARRCEAEQAEEAKISDAMAASASASAIEVGAAATGSIENQEQALKAVTTITDLGHKVARYWYEKMPSDPRPYMLTRTAAWILVENLPDAQGGVTQIPPLPEEMLANLRQLHSSGQFKAVILEVESLVPRYPFWFEAHRLVATALERLGSEYQPAARVVALETVEMLERLPGLAELKFVDGTVFVDGETRAWLNSTRPAANDNPRDVFDAEDRKMVKLAYDDAASGRLKDALNRLETAGRLNSTRRDQVLWRVKTAEMLLKVDKAEVALPITRSLVEEVKRFQLQEWEPELAAHICELALLAYKRVPGEDGTQDVSKEWVLQIHTMLGLLAPSKLLSTTEDLL